MNTPEDNRPLNEAEAILADIEGIEAVYEIRRIADQKRAELEAQKVEQIQRVQ